MLRRAHEHVLKPPRLHSALPSPPRVAFQNPKTIREKLVHFRLKEFIYKDAGNSISVVILSVIKSKTFESGDQFESNRISFPFDCNKCCVVYLLTC